MCLKYAYTTGTATNLGCAGGICVCTTAVIKNTSFIYLTYLNLCKILKPNEKNQYWYTGSQSTYAQTCRK